MQQQQQQAPEGPPLIPGRRGRVRWAPGGRIRPWKAAAAASRPFVATRSLQGGDAPSAPAAPFWDPQQGLRRSSDPLAQELARVLETVSGFALHLFSEHQQLKSRLHSLETQHRDRVSHLLAENNRLQQEIQELESSPEASRSPPTGPQRSAPQPSPPKGQETPGKVFPMQIRTAGKTGGCERLFLNDVSRLLSRQGVSLKVEEYTETSEHPLLMFCPIASRLDTDIESAFQVLSGKQKVLLVVMHYAHKEQTGPFRQQTTTHPSVVMTVHTRFTVLEGMYACEMNKAAVADVADTIKSLADDP
ncbi:hypothetical protein JRQ81_005419 [Phrynocephalus forsythii]|uniref:Uncharacterized protein n=1 Tax=Phrynocephalus forsythii TaxID=171643 RepID=A0A9Q1B5T8_9SAUR|nr:hypothetical protein JRQ81_005419 [Phrynocephalus forsythii]